MTPCSGTKHALSFIISRERPWLLKQNPCMFRVTQGSNIHLDHRAYQHKSCRYLQSQSQQVFHLILLCSLGTVPKHWAVKIRYIFTFQIRAATIQFIIGISFPRDSNLAQEVVIERIIGKVSQISSYSLLCFCTGKIHSLVILPYLGFARNHWKIITPWDRIIPGTSFILIWESKIMRMLYCFYLKIKNSIQRICFNQFGALWRCRDFCLILICI